MGVVLASRSVEEDLCVVEIEVLDQVGGWRRVQRIDVEGAVSGPDLADMLGAHVAGHDVQERKARARVVSVLGHVVGERTIRRVAGGWL